ncbi:alpha/beta hydrolase [Parvibaculum sp.]|jgi:pimeloyl-ACP methyl ester carboxylesterase|uniref:alpha/beta fold hydrolase n=1 Tax=Parvibaculum sp. TaxID=2024848 RepID=UPI000C522765|nr:alpha/beta hydrolase [Parvibaculum sp.]MAM93159.1 alpha/beta hydrolase [Parvibaculum sp.]|tara:strand:- start:27431 stop:28522 length:1092 start_codon:yes stop_codon:yes gene_type:complete
MPKAQANGIEIEYESFGSEKDETILLIMGLGAQLTQWPIELCHDLVSRGYRVIRFDNRDCGLSTHIERGRALAWPDAVLSLMQGKAAFVPYTLGDMAADAVGLLDALHIERAHIAGASMGGMIAQHVAFDFPERVLSLTSIMSSSGNPLLPPARPRVYSLFLSPAPPAHDMQAIVARGVKTYEVLGSPGFPTDRETLREWVTRDAARAYYPAGVKRQMAAVMADGDRRAKLRTIAVPAMVIHGEDDPLVPVAAGLDTAANIPGCDIRIMQGMGHEMPLPLLPAIADAIVETAERATGKKRAPAPAPLKVSPKEPVSPLPVIDDAPAVTLAHDADAPVFEASEKQTRLRRWWTKARGYFSRSEK